MVAGNPQTRTRARVGDGGSRGGHAVGVRQRFTHHLQETRGPKGRPALVNGDVERALGAVAGHQRRAAWIWRCDPRRRQLPAVTRGQGLGLHRLLRGHGHHHAARRQRQGAPTTSTADTARHDCGSPVCMRALSDGVGQLERAERDREYPNTAEVRCVKLKKDDHEFEY